MLEIVYSPFCCFTRLNIIVYVQAEHILFVYFYYVKVNLFVFCSEHAQHYLQKCFLWGEHKTEYNSHSILTNDSQRIGIEFSKYFTNIGPEMVKHIPIVVSSVNSSSIAFHDFKAS